MMTTKPMLPSLAAALLAATLMMSGPVHAKNQALPNFESSLAKAQKGDRDAQYDLAVLYQTGVDIPADLPKAFYWYQKSAEAGEIASMHALAQMAEYGEGHEKDIPLALKWYRKAAEGGVTDAMAQLGRLLAAGHEGEEGKVEAKKWLLKASKRGDIPSTVLLGDLARNGIGQEKNEQEAVRYWKQAATRGDLDAIHRMIGYYGIKKDTKRMKYWQKKGCEMGDNCTSDGLAK